MPPIEAKALDDAQLFEHASAVLGYAVISQATWNELERIKALNYAVPLCELDAVVFAVFAGAYGDYHRTTVMA